MPPFLGLLCALSMSDSVPIRVRLLFSQVTGSISEYGRMQFRSMSETIQVHIQVCSDALHIRIRILLGFGGGSPGWILVTLCMSADVYAKETCNAQDKD